MKRKFGKKSGFSLVEIIIAAMILSAATITLGAICNKCIRNVKDSREYERAWEILDRQLTLVDYVGLGEFVKNGMTSATVEDENLVYSWQMETQEHEISGLYQVKMSVYWPAEKPEHSISANTMLIAEMQDEEEETE